jgi:RNase adaptor protein for sRNA GlmZ degradation
MHRSVYVAEAVAKRLAAKHHNIRTHHSEVR